MAGLAGLPQTLNPYAYGTGKLLEFGWLGLRGASAAGERAPRLTPAQRIAAIAAHGAAAEARAAADLSKAGYQVLGRHVTARTSAGLRCIDILARTPTGQIVAAEVKVAAPSEPRPNSRRMRPWPALEQPSVRKLVRCPAP